MRTAKKSSGFECGAEEDRTPDLRIANATLSQLSYRPMESNCIGERLSLQPVAQCIGAGPGNQHCHTKRASIPNAPKELPSVKGNARPTPQPAGRRLNFQRSQS